MGLTNSMSWETKETDIYKCREDKKNRFQFHFQTVIYKLEDVEEIKTKRKNISDTQLVDITRFSSIQFRLADEKIFFVTVAIFMKVSKHLNNFSEKFKLNEPCMLQKIIPITG